MNLYKQQIKAISDLRNAVTELNDVLTEMIVISNKYSTDNDDKLLNEMKNRIAKDVEGLNKVRFLIHVTPQFKAKHLKNETTYLGMELGHLIYSDNMYEYQITERYERRHK